MRIQKLARIYINLCVWNGSQCDTTIQEYAYNIDNSHNLRSNGLCNYKAVDKLKCDPIKDNNGMSQ